MIKCTFLRSHISAISFPPEKSVIRAPKWVKDAPLPNLVFTFTYRSITCNLYTGGVLGVN